MMIHKTYKYLVDGVYSIVKVVLDDDYETIGSYAYDTEEATTAIEEEEMAKLADGEWGVFGIILFEECANCELPKELDSIWGIVCEPEDAELLEAIEEHYGLAVENLVEEQESV